MEWLFTRDAALIFNAFAGPVIALVSLLATAFIGYKTLSNQRRLAESSLRQTRLIEEAKIAASYDHKLLEELTKKVSDLIAVGQLRRRQKVAKLEPQAADIGQQTQLAANIESANSDAVRLIAELGIMLDHTDDLEYDLAIKARDYYKACYQDVGLDDVVTLRLALETAAFKVVKARREALRTLIRNTHPAPPPSAKVDG